MEFLYQIVHPSDLNDGSGQIVELNIYFERKFDAEEFIKSKHFKENYGAQGQHGSKSNIRVKTI